MYAPPKFSMHEKPVKYNSEFMVDVYNEVEPFLEALSDWAYEVYREVENHARSLHEVDYHSHKKDLWDDRV